MKVWFQELGMQILLWILALEDSIFEVFGATAGLTDVVGEQSLGEYVFSLPAITKAFWAVVIAAVLICGVCTIVAIVKNTIAKNIESKSHVRTVGQSISVIFVTLFMAIFLVSGVTISGALLRAINAEFNGGKEIIVSHRVLDLSVNGGGMIYDESNILGLNKYDDDGNAVYISPLYSFEIDQSVKVSSFEDLKPKYYPDHEGAVILFKKDRTTFERFDEIYTINTQGKYEIKDFSELVPLTENTGYYINYATGEHYSAADFRSDISTETVTHIFGRYNTAAGFPTEWIAPSASQAGAGWQKFVGFMSAASKVGITNFKDYFTDTYWADAVSDTPGIINPDNFNFLIAYLTAIILLIALLGATLGLVKRLYDLVFLFIALPGIAATIPLDDGAKFKLWRETVISKVFLAYGSVLAVNVFFIIAPSLWNVGIYSASSFTNTVLRAVLICGGALTISGGQLLFARLLGTSAEESREMGQSARTLFGGAMTGIGLGKAAGRGIFGTKNAYGQRVGGILKGGAGVLGAVGGGAINTVGTLAGGQAYKNSHFGQGVSKVQQALRGFANSSGYFGKDKVTGGNTLFGALGGAIGAGANKFANSNTAQSSGLDKGIIGGAQKLGQTIRSKASLPYSTGLEKENVATERAKDIAEAFGVSPYNVKHVKEKKSKE